MGDQTPPLDRRALLRAVASTHLPLPLDIDIFEVEQGFHSTHATLRVDDNRPDFVDQWAAAFGATKPTYGGVVPAGEPHKEFRSYEVRIVLAGWDTAVCSFVDTDVVPADKAEAVES